VEWILQFLILALDSAEAAASNHQHNCALLLWVARTPHNFVPALVVPHFMWRYVQLFFVKVKGPHLTKRLAHFFYLILRKLVVAEV
jgi:hypothetical protein